MAAVPQIEGLTVEDFLRHAREKPALLRYLPDEKDWNHLDKKWVCDVLYTQDTEAVKTMITKAMHDRKRRLEESQDLLVDMRPEFAAALKRCQTFSCKFLYPMTYMQPQRARPPTCSRPRQRLSLIHI